MKAGEQQIKGTLRYQLLQTPLQEGLGVFCATGRPWMLPMLLLLPPPPLALHPSQVPPTSLAAFVFNGGFFSYSVYYRYRRVSHSQASVPGLPDTKPSPKLLFLVVSEMLPGPS